MSQVTDVENTVRKAAKAAEGEVQRWIAYINDEVVPELRRHSFLGLQTAAEHLRRGAEYLDWASTRGTGPGTRRPKSTAR